MIYTMKYTSPVGEILLAEKNGALMGLWIEGQTSSLNPAKETIVEKTDSSILNQTQEWLDAYFNGKRPAISELKLCPEGSEFRQEVWNILCEIPYGEVTTYGEIAHRIARKRGLDRMSAQAVGGAVGHNPISIIIPCHRVIGTNGNLTGYGGGIEKKIKLLKHEGVDMTNMFFHTRKKG